MPFPPDFVRARGTQFTLHDAPFSVVGVNCYFLAYCPEPTRRAVMQAIKQISANTIRCWAFLDSASPPADGLAFQYAEDGRICINDGPNGLGRLDALVAAAEQEGLRLILPLVNHWKDFGGMPMYLQWLGLPQRDDQFYRAPQARDAYRAYAQALISRYVNSPAILAWELTNEARCEVPGGRELLLDWTAEMSQYVKSLDPNHLVALGDEGFLKHSYPPNHLYNGQHGVDFEATLGIPEIDFGTYHFYPGPNASGMPNEFGNQWITDHIGSGNRANKPVILEEYGVRLGIDVASALDRDRCYAEWLETNSAAGGAGDLLWMFGSQEPDVAGFRDDYTVFAFDDVPSVVAHIDQMLHPPEIERTTNAQLP
jgi:mannan endo-1,4-beta-mannosidase